MAASDGSQGPSRLGPPPPEYRPTRGYEGGDSSMRNLALAAVAIAAVVMGGVWAMSGRHHGGVPVIEPESTPLRVKPANPGGMQVAGADDAFAGSGGAEADLLAPPPEVPAPQMLQRAARAANAAAAHPPGGAAIVAAPVATPPPPPSLSPPPTVPAAPAPAPALGVVPAAKPLPPRPAPPLANGGAQVQLAALESEAAAKAAWADLARRMPQLLGGRSPVVTRVELDDKTFWRLRLGGFADIAAATEFCAKVRAKGGGCAIASF